ncbi:Putative conserved hypothetical protein [Candidatus Fokinia solitaria]|uniref:Uncharacterized protein n=1 Tax=Candidatus Fokinia solitaria TaxID=1802984 RepID=A0A2U8BRY2_9RICK|nr:hypothetical protein [Candidatus Fokinia solitaria]AWD33099.1 Putative conserved hypothetical protein [Candidatus Fokinia solitaria]
MRKGFFRFATVAICGSFYTTLSSAAGTNSNPSVNKPQTTTEVIEITKAEKPQYGNGQALISNEMLNLNNSSNTTSIQDKAGSLSQQITVGKEEVKILVKPVLNVQYGAVMNDGIFKSADALLEEYDTTDKSDFFKKKVYPYNLMSPGNPSRWGDFSGLVNFNNVVVDVSVLHQGLKYGGNLSLYANVSRPTSGGGVMTAGEACVYCESVEHKIKVKAGSTVGVQNELLLSANNLAKGGMGLSGDLPFYIQYPAVAPYNQQYKNGSIYDSTKPITALFTLQPFVDSPSLPGPANIAPKANKISVTKIFEFSDISTTIGASFTPDTQVKGTLSSITSIPDGSLNGFQNVIGYGGKIAGRINADLEFEVSLVGEFCRKFNTICSVEKMKIIREDLGLKKDKDTITMQPKEDEEGNVRKLQKGNVTVEDIKFDIKEGETIIKDLELERNGGNAIAIGGLLTYKKKYALALGYGDYGSTGNFAAAKINGKVISNNAISISPTTGYYISAGASYTGNKNGVSITYLYGNANGLRQQQMYQVLTGMPKENFEDGNKSQFVSFAYDRKLLPIVSCYLSCDHFSLSSKQKNPTLQNGITGDSGWAVAVGLKLKG